MALMFLVLADMWKSHDTSTANLHVRSIGALLRRAVSVRLPITAIT